MAKKVILKTKKNSTKLPDEVYYNSKKRIGAVLTQSGEIETGLTLEEEEALLPRILRISKSDPNFQEKVKDYYANLSTEVEPGGTALEIGEGKNGEYLSPIDYLKYRLALVHPKVAKTEEDADRALRYHYFIYDPTKAEREEYETLQASKKAYTEYVRISKDEDKVRIVLLYFGESPDTLSEQQKDIKLSKLAKDAPLDFQKIAKDKHLETKAFILECVSKSVLQKVGNAFYDGDDKLGDTMDDSVKFLEDNANSDRYVKLQSRLKAAK